MSTALHSRYLDWGKRRLRTTLADRDRARVLDQLAWADLAHSGFFGLLVDKAYGGAGVSLAEYVAAFSGLAEGSLDIPFALSAGAHGGVATLLLNLYANAAQKSRIMPRMALGSPIAAICNTEAGAGTDIRGIKSKIEMKTEITGVVNAHKSIATNLSAAELFFVSVWKHHGEQKPAFEVLLVEAGASVRQQALDLAGFWTGATGSLAIEGLVVDLPDARLGGEGSGFDVLKACFSLERLLIPVILGGVLGGMLDEGMRYIQTRAAFGKPIASFQYVQDKLVTIYRAKRTIEAQISALTAAPTLREALSQNKELSLLKYSAVELATEAAQVFFEVFGGQGYGADHVSQKLLRDVLALKALGGTAEQHKSTIFAELASDSVAAAKPNDAVRIAA